LLLVAVISSSVFIFYISIGKIFGGTAPILVGGHGDEHEGGSHSGDDAHGGEAHGVDSGVDAHGAAEIDEKIANHAPDKPESLHGAHGANPVDATAGHADETANDAGDHAEKIVNDLHSIKDASNKITLQEPEGAFEIKHADGGEVATSGAAHGGDAAHAVADVIYTNPLPHVLILTAIVVGVATTAVGLALAVRIREAYGTIEEDELEADDLIAEFGAGDHLAEASR